MAPKPSLFGDADVPHNKKRGYEPHKWPKQLPKKKIVAQTSESEANAFWHKNGPNSPGVVAQIPQRVALDTPVESHRRLGRERLAVPTEPGGYEPQNQ